MHWQKYTNVNEIEGDSDLWTILRENKAGLAFDSSLRGAWTRSG